MNPNVQQQSQHQGEQQPQQGQPQDQNQGGNDGTNTFLSTFKSMAIHWGILSVIVFILVLRGDPILQVASEVRITFVQMFLKKDEKADLQKFEIANTQRLYDSCVYYNQQRELQTDPEELTKSAKAAVKETITGVTGSVTGTKMDLDAEAIERKANKSHFTEYQCAGWAMSIPEIRRNN